MLCVVEARVGTTVVFILTIPTGGTLVAADGSTCRGKHNGNAKSQVCEEQNNGIDSANAITLLVEHLITCGESPDLSHSTEVS